MPLTDSDSCTSEEIEAIDSCRVMLTRRRCSPTLRVSQTKSGSSASEKTASRQSSRNIAITVATTVVTFEVTEVAVDVTTSSTPPMSFAIRLCTSPVRVRVKNASDRRCRCR
jgi:hypothetical protein